ncbi:MAG TPA: hypothetical protein VKP66_11725 [Steroidobacteraceae bacterium]|nr:hypothetical protein [Steroidobacteraceae bacterium]
MMPSALRDDPDDTFAALLPANWESTKNRRSVLSRCPRAHRLVQPGRAWLMLHARIRADGHGSAPPTGEHAEKIEHRLFLRSAREDHGYFPCVT